MFTWIEKNRKKTDKEKEFMAFVISAFITGLIFVFWLSANVSHFKNSGKKSGEKLNLSSSQYIKAGFMSSILANFPGLENFGGKINDTTTQIKKLLGDIKATKEINISN